MVDIEQHLAINNTYFKWFNKLYKIVFTMNGFVFGINGNEKVQVPILALRDEDLYPEELI